VRKNGGTDGEKEGGRGRREGIEDGWKQWDENELKGGWIER